MFLINPFMFAPVDPYFSNVSLLLHGNGANGSTTIIDSSPSPKTVTAVGGAQISTAQSRFGGASLFFNGSSSYLTIPDNNDFEFGSGNFTIEGWFYVTTANTNRMIVAKSNRNDGGGKGSFALQISNTNKLQMLFDKDLTNTDLEDWDINVLGTSTISLNTWHYFGLVRNGNLFTAYLNGSIEATATNSMSLVNNSQLLTIGVLGYTTPPFVNYFPGHIDELRITKGVARDVSVVPIGPFLDL